MKLTKARVRFLSQSANGARFTQQDLRGSEIVMAGALIADGLLSLEHDPLNHEWFYAITKAGLSAITKEDGHG